MRGERDALEATDDDRTVATQTTCAPPAARSATGGVPAARRPESPVDDRDVGYVEDERDEVVHDDRQWERPVVGYRRGRGGYDPEAAALTARARYAFRQRVVLAMLVAVLVTGVVAAASLPVVWWAHAAVDVLLVSYLCYLRRQVRLEEAIRARRAARMAGTRRPTAVEHGEEPPGVYDDRVEEDEPAVSEDDPAAAHEVPVEERAALPRLQPAPPPPLPPGTTLVEADEEELLLQNLDPPEHRRAAGE